MPLIGRQHAKRRGLAAVAPLLAALLAGASALADEPDAEGPEPHRDGVVGSEEVAACVRSFEVAQTLRDDDELLAARAELSTCTRDVCPEVVRRKCREWLFQVAADVPSLAITLTGPDGRPASLARIRIDGVAAVPSAEGAPIEVDPGAHTIEVELEGARVEQRVTLRRGEKNTPLAVSFVPPPPPIPTTVRATAPEPLRKSPDAPRRGGLHPLVWTGLGLAGAGLAVGFVAGVITLDRRAEVADRCRGAGCSQDEIDGVYTMAHVSTGGFVVAGAGAVIALASWLALSPRSATATAR